MIEESGRVVALEGEGVWVQVIRQSACQSCSARKGCGQAALAGMSGGRAHQVWIENPLGAQVGDQVRIGVSEAAMLRASLLVYLVPLLALMLAAVVASGAGLGEGWVVLSGGTGLVFGFGMVRYLQRALASRGACDLVMLKILC
ncbi:MAG: SoxR reducing system RseC family protein [Gammaproteobacteria bacterium]|nr:SoxR reducing system RseC family protein [Gammaproteobacteria bacterium]